MLTSVIGIILFIIPFVLVSFFFDKRRGFVCVLLYVLSFHIILAFLTQLLGIFYYQVIFWAVLIFDVMILALFLKFRTRASFKFSNIDWLAILVVAIACLTLYQVHYNYTGQISLAIDASAVNAGEINLPADEAIAYHDVANMKYVYPYFSDEWYAISLIQGSISSHGLPFKEPLNNKFFMNLEVFTHSFLAELMLFFGLNPLTQYTLLSIIINSLAILIAYIFLRVAKVSKLSSAICALSILYIACSSSLPGIWNLIPINLGVLFFLIWLCFMELEDTKMMLLAFLAISLFYPVLMPFYGLGTLIFLFSKIKILRENKFKIISCSALGLFVSIPVILITLLLSPWQGSINYIFSRLFYLSLDGQTIPQYGIFYVVPTLILLLSIVGLPWLLKNKKWLFWQLVVGISYWVLYSFIFYRIIIEFERAVFLTSVIICLTAGFGLRRLSEYINLKFKNNGLKTAKYTQIAAIILFLLLIPFYTLSNAWQNFVCVDAAGNTVIYPRATANEYLTREDLQIFKNIKDREFLSIPWKGLVIGVATGNHPVVAKQGNVSVGAIDIFNNFLKGDCNAKTTMAKELNLDYIYLYDFNCPGFDKVSHSSEGLTLYKVEKS